jgi:hypothetical protein
MVLLAVTGCGGSDRATKSGHRESTQAEEGSRQAAGDVPASLGRVESGAEDAIDLARAGDRAEVVKTVRAMRRAAEGAAATDLRAAAVPESQIEALRDRARLLAGLAPRAGLVRVSLAANGISALMPELYARYEDPVPPDVLKLDYLDREAQLRSLAGDRASVPKAAQELSTTWTELRPQVLDAKGKRVAARYDRHVRSMRRRARGPNDEALQREAVRGLELVDELEHQFRAR